MDKPQIVNYETKLCADILQPLFDMTWDGLGESPVPGDVLTHIGGAPIIHSHSWSDISDPPLLFPPDAHTHDHNSDITGRDLPDSHPVSAITGLQADLDTRATIAFVDAENTRQDAENIGLIIALS